MTADTNSCCTNMSRENYDYLFSAYYINYETIPPVYMHTERLIISHFQSLQTKKNKNVGNPYPCMGYMGTNVEWCNRLIECKPSDKWISIDNSCISKH